MPCTRRAVLALLIGLPWAARASSRVPAEVAAELPEARLQGSGRMTWFGWPVYEARLWVDAAFRADTYAQHRLALELEYARDLRGERIAERSLEEIRRGGEIGAGHSQAWLTSMRELFPDVTRNDRLTAVHHPGRSLRLYLNAKRRGELADADFAPRFLGIWLGSATSEPQLRRALLGEHRAAP